MLLTRVAEADGGVALAGAITLDMAKRQLDILHANDDVLIGGLIRSAQAHLEGPDGTGGVLGRPVVRHVFDGVLADFPAFGAPIRLPCPPLVSVASVKYYDTDGVQQTLADTEYSVSKHPVTPLIRCGIGQDWPLTANIHDAVTVRFTCGPAETPEDIRHAMLLLVAHLFNNRGYDQQDVKLPAAIDALLGPHRTHGWI